MPTRLWFVAALSATAFVLALRQDLRGLHPRGRSLPYERIDATDLRAVRARDDAAYARQVEQAYSDLLDSLYDHRRANPGRAFDGLELGSFPSDDVLERANGDVRLRLDEHGQLVALYADVERSLWFVCRDGTCRPPALMLEPRLVATWGAPDVREDDGDYIVWNDPPLRLRATLRDQCELRFERY